MFPPGHQSLVNDLRGIIPASINMYAFFDHRIRSGSKGFTGFISTGLDLRPLVAWGLGSHRVGGLG